MLRVPAVKVFAASLGPFGPENVLPKRTKLTKLPLITFGQWPSVLNLDLPQW
jgi:hypothetical protein